MLTENDFILTSIYFRCVNEDPLNGSNWYKNGLSVPIKKLTNTQLKAKKILHPDLKLLKPEIRTLGGRVTPEVEISESKPQETVKTSYGRQSKPVLVPIKTENVRCEHCQDLFRSLYKLKRHMEKVHSDQLEKPCQKVLPMGYVPAPIHGKIFENEPAFLAVMDSIMFKENYTSENKILWGVLQMINCDMC